MASGGYAIQFTPVQDASIHKPVADSCKPKYIRHQLVVFKKILLIIHPFYRDFN